MDFPNISFLHGLTQVANFFFHISRYLKDNSFDIVWQYHPHRDSSKIFLEWPRVPFYSILEDVKETNILT